jgi:hypothetical protein
MASPESESVPTSEPTPALPGQRLRDAVTDSIHYWEPMRLAYDGVLVAIVAGYFVAGWPYSQTTVTLDGVLILFLLAVLANIAYCVAYVGDVFVQFSGHRDTWHRWRWALWLIGTGFAAIITRFFAMAFFMKPAGA